MARHSARILVVDDQENNQLVIEDILRKQKHRITFASSGEEALSKLETDYPDLILMDQMMPGLSGIETTEQLKAHPVLKEIPVIMVTAKTDTETLKEAFAAGAVDYITKPIEKTALLARVNSTLRTKYAFDEIKELTQTLQLQKQELLNFTSMVSHDLKSPLASACSLFDFFLYRLKEEHPHIWEEASMHELLSRIPNTFKRMLSFIDTLLDYASAGKVIGNVEEVSVSQLLSEVLSHFEHLKNDGVVQFEVQDNLPTLPGDATKLAQVWQNLISNAIKYRGDQTPVTLQIGAQSSDTQQTFWIQDNGPGIPAEYHDQVFQPFQRLETEVEGSGIGLATVSKIINAHKGQISIDPDYQDGARFVMTFPEPTFHE